MAIQKRFKVDHGDVFAQGAYVKGGAEKVLDFDVKVARGEERPQQKDKETGLPIWQVMVIDPDDDAGKKDTTVGVKFLAKVKPILPENKTPFPFTPVEFVGLEALPYVDDSGVRVENGQVRGRARIAWSFRAESMVEPGGERAAERVAAKVAAANQKQAS
jgi:hypothetical protein